MTPETKARLRKVCADLLQTNGYKIKSAKGKETVQVFWLGVLNALNEPSPDAHVTICLMSGRYEDLCDFTSRDPS